MDEERPPPARVEANIQNRPNDAVHVMVNAVDFMAQRGKATKEELIKVLELQCR